MTLKDDIPEKVVIFRAGSSFHVIVADVCGSSGQAGLSYDEMLGRVARAFCPVTATGKISRGLTRCLFVSSHRANESKENANG